MAFHILDHMLAAVVVAETVHTKAAVRIPPAAEPHNQVASEAASHSAHSVELPLWGRAWEFS